MAPRVKAAGSKPKAKKPKTSKTSGGDRGSNTLSREEAQEEFEDIFKLHDKLGRVTGSVRKEIADAYATSAQRLGVSKKTVKHMFKLEQMRRKIEDTEKDFNSTDREGFLKLAQVFGEDTPFGQFAQKAADNAHRDGLGESETDNEPADDEEA